MTRTVERPTKPRPYPSRPGDFVARRFPARPAWWQRLYRNWIAPLFEKKAAKYGLALIAILIGHAAIASTWHIMRPVPFTIYVTAVICAALYGGLGPGIVATVLATLDLDYSYIPPYHSLTVSFNDVFSLVGFLVVAVVVSSLQGRRLRAEESLRGAHLDLERRVIERTAELTRSREQFSLLVNKFSDLAFFMLDASGRVASWNEGAQRLLGFNEADILGRHVSCLWPDSGFGSDQTWSVPDERYEHHDWITRSDGSRVWAYIFVTQLKGADQKPRGHAISIRDVTERRTLEKEILDISERERQRIGHDLHDGLGQELTGVALLTTALSQRLTEVGDPSAEEAEQIADLIHESIGHTRALARGLCPLDLEDEGLPEAIRQMAERLARLPRMRCEFESPVHVKVEASVGGHLYRIVQEAVTNAVRHGKCQLIHVRLIQSDERLTLIVADDGVGISDSQSGAGMGLRLMRYRATMIGAALDIRRGDAGGTVVECSLSIAEDQSHDSST